MAPAGLKLENSTCDVVSRSGLEAKGTSTRTDDFHAILGKREEIVAGRRKRLKEKPEVRRAGCREGGWLLILSNSHTTSMEISH